MSIAHKIIARLTGKPIPLEKQRMLERLAAEVNRQREHKHRKLGPHRPDTAAYLDAHSLPNPRF
jgi:hypothetical protein